MKFSGLNQKQFTNLNRFLGSEDNIITTPEPFLLPEGKSLSKSSKMLFCKVSRAEQKQVSAIVCTTNITLEVVTDIEFEKGPDEENRYAVPQKYLLSLLDSIDKFKK